ncbi:hypothetical protein FJZ18_04430 [Candidatus Pacearchaeota archaeon]|nr:hypothetical protein [Candidatus Pacearchaeota archaeon]
MVSFIDFSPTVPPLPRIEDKKKINVRYMLAPPYTSAHIYWDSKINELVYEIEEPLLHDYEHEALKKLESAMLELININVAVDKTLDAASEYIDKTARLLIDELNMKVTNESYHKIFYYLFRDFIGLNDLDPLLRDYFIEDVECNGVDTPVYVVHRVYRNLRTNLRYHDVEEIASFVEKLAQRTGRYVSYAQPLLDGALPDGSRVNATYTKDVTSRGPTFCLKKGLVQLNDGNVKDISKLFEDSKKIFGSKIEEGNEIVEPINLRCCGVEAENLEQKNSRIKSIIKVKSPEKLVKVTFEDGGEAEVTLDHQFHVADDKLHTLEARELKPGMLVPMPARIKAEGYRQKVDVYSLLKDFSYHKNISIISSQPILQLVQQVVRSVASSEDHGKYRQLLAQTYGVGPSYFYEILSRGNSLSFNVLDHLCKNQSFDFSNLGAISLNVYGGGTKEKSKTIKVPFEIDETLAYLAGIIASDGHLSPNSIDICTFEEGLRNKVQEALQTTFGKYETYYGGNRVYLCNSFVPFFFQRVFDIPYGKKAHSIAVPQIIFKSDHATVSAFLRGLFDGDGTMSAGLSYKTSSEKLAEGISYLLARLSIYSYIRKESGEYRLNIPSPYYQSFADQIGFYSPRKKERLAHLLSKQISHKTFIRHQRVPAAPFLAIIRKIGIIQKKLLRECNVSFNRIYYPTFSREFAQALLSSFEKHPRIQEVEPELKEIRKMIGQPCEFIPIKEVAVVENKDPVYDIELEPCTYYIAGNKPMHMFDTIRKFTKIPWTPTQLITLNTVSPEMLAYFWILIQYKTSILIAGGTASGKTTLLNAMAFFIPPEARVVSIEDTREINLPRENWLPAVSRTSIGVGKVGEVDLFAILKNSFRQTPDYLIVGEVRGKEAFVLFQGMASGHAAISTMHADSVDTLIRRLQTPPIELSPTLVNSLDCVAVMSHAIVDKHETRRLREVVEIVNVNRDGTAMVNSPMKWDPAKDVFFFKKQSKVFEKISNRHGIPVEKLEKEFATRAKLMYALYQQKVFRFEEVQKVINDYYKNPVEVLNTYNIVE